MTKENPDKNLALWLSVEKTDPRHVKSITGKQYSGTSPKPYYLVHKATETFGPCGIGWGFSIVEERIEEGAGGERMSIARVRVWYKWDGERGEVEHVGGTPFCGQRASGKAFTDEDAPKKSVTDALVKALSMIGFAGDIFMGRYDDSKYVAELREEIAEEHGGGTRQPEAAKKGAPAPARREPEYVADLNLIRDTAAKLRTPDAYFDMVGRSGFMAKYENMPAVGKTQADAALRQARERLGIVDDIRDLRAAG